MQRMKLYMFINGVIILKQQSQSLTMLKNIKIKHSNKIVQPIAKYVFHAILIAGTNYKLKPKECSLYFKTLICVTSPPSPYTAHEM